jgi:hypothetical protein
VRVFGRQTHARNESDVRWDAFSSGGAAPSTDLENISIGLSRSTSAGTRKMVNYA